MKVVGFLIEIENVINMSYEEEMYAMLYNPLGYFDKKLIDIYWAQFLMKKYDGLFKQMAQQN